MTYPAAAIRTAIAELLEGTIGSGRTVPTSTLARGVWAGQPAQTTKAKAVQTSTARHRFDVQLGRLSNHPSTPLTSIGNLRICWLEITILVTSNCATVAQEDQRAADLATIATDCNTAAEALGYPHNLAMTSAYAETGLVGGCLVGPDGTSVPAVEAGQETWGTTQLVRTAIRARGIVQMETATNATPEYRIVLAGQSNAAFARAADYPFAGEDHVRVGNIAVGATTLATDWASGTKYRKRLIWDVGNVPSDALPVVILANGESDLDSDADTNAFGANLEALKTDVETQTGRTDMLWVIVRLHADSTRGTLTRRTTLRAAEDDFAAAHTNVEIVTPDDLTTLVDDVHWTDAGRAAVLAACESIIDDYASVVWSGGTTASTASSPDTIWSDAQQIAWFRETTQRSGLNVTSWDDKFDNGNDLPAPSGAEPIYAPTGGPNGTAKIGFDGATQYLATASATWAGASANLFLWGVMRVDTAYGSGDEAAFQIEPTILYTRPTTTKRLVFRQTTSDEEAVASSPAAGEWVAFWCELLDDCHVRIRVGDNRPVTAQIATSGASTTKIGIGGNYVGGALSECSWAELGAVTRASETQKELLATYLNNRYGFDLDWSEPTPAVGPDEIFSTGKLLKLSGDGATVSGARATGSTVTSVTDEFVGHSFAGGVSPTFGLSDGGTATLGTGHRPVILGNGSQYLSSTASVHGANLSRYGYVRYRSTTYAVGDAILHLNPTTLYLSIVPSLKITDEATGTEVNSGASSVLDTAYNVVRWRIVDSSTLAIRANNLSEVTVSHPGAVAALNDGQLFANGSGANILAGEISDVVVIEGTGPTDEQDRLMGEWFNETRRTALGW